YRVLDVDGVRLSRYELLYFDTEKFDLFHKHHRGKSNRHKIRFRKYVESNLNYFEIKYKNNRGRTIKKRVEQNVIVQTISNDAEEFLHNHTEIRSSELLPQFWSDFSRITLANRTLPERVTLDMNLQFRKDEKKYFINDLVIAEVKQEKFITSTFLKLMKKHHVREGSVSKYCLGVIKMNNDIKHNNFKPKLRNINKVIYGASSGT
ncbi:MAG: VTC domain-containing protein, partial [Bacteroidia bacterium]|nr:VTC domain-containing protein [Bacteroidia bacterium]